MRLRGAIFSISVEIKRLADWLAYILHCLWVLVAKIYLIGNHRKISVIAGLNLELLIKSLSILGFEISLSWASSGRSYVALLGVARTLTGY